jgi:hypothetical protein
MKNLASQRAKEVIDIEQLLDWAYRVQCVDKRVGQLRPRGPAAYPGAAPFAEYAMLGTRVDTSRSHAADIMRFQADDALTIHDAVLALDEMWIEWRAGDEAVIWDHKQAASSGMVIAEAADGWRLYPSYQQGVADHPGVLLEQAGTSVLVIIHAKAANRPDVHEDWKPARGAQAADGSRMDHWGRKRKSGEGVSAGEVMHARAIYMVWHAALSVLAVDLEGALSGFAVSGLLAPTEPWQTAPARVLKSIPVHIDLPRKTLKSKANK